MKLFTKLPGLLFSIGAVMASLLLSAIIVFAGWILLTHSLDTVINNYGFGMALLIPSAVLSLCGAIWFHPAFLHKEESEEGFVDPDKTFMVNSDRSVEYVLFVSYDAGNSFQEFRRAGHPEELTYATVYFDAMGMRWLMEDDGGNPVVSHTSKICQGLSQTLG